MVRCTVGWVVSAPLRLRICHLKEMEELFERDRQAHSRLSRSATPLLVSSRKCDRAMNGVVECEHGQEDESVRADEYRGISLPGVEY